jgi:predicted nucleotidyltransferase component of viral defense system
MIDRNDILTYARLGGADPFWIENDYLQHIALISVYSEFSNELVFKGGTALQKVYGLNRLSRDLDFNLSDMGSASKMKNVVKRINDYYESSYVGPDRVKHGIGFTLSVKGPSYNDTGVQHKLPITMNIEEKLELKPLFKTINPGKIYKDPDLITYSLLVIDEIEAMAEKIRALVTRKEVEPRDVYDIWFMLNSGVKVDVDMVKRKVEFDHGRFSARLLKNKLEEVRNLWEKDLNPLVRPLPEYEEVHTYLLGKFKAFDAI